MKSFGVVSVAWTSGDDLGGLTVVLGLGSLTAIHVSARGVGVGHDVGSCEVGKASSEDDQET